MLLRNLRRSIMLMYFNERCLNCFHVGTSRSRARGDIPVFHGFVNSCQFLIHTHLHSDGSSLQIDAKHEFPEFAQICMPWPLQLLLESPSLVRPTSYLSDTYSGLSRISVPTHTAPTHFSAANPRGTPRKLPRKSWQKRDMLDCLGGD